MHPDIFSSKGDKHWGEKEAWRLNLLTGAHGTKGAKSVFLTG